MGQYEVYKWLKDRRESGDESFFTTREIEDALKDSCTNGQLKGVRADLIRLTVSGYVEMLDMDETGFNNYNRVFRYKKNE